MITVYIDGCVEPRNPGGHGAAGWVVYEDALLGPDGAAADPAGVDGLTGKHKLTEGSRYFEPDPFITNNFAEYQALREAMKWLYRNGRQGEVIHFLADSQLVIRQMFGDWRMIKGAYVETAKACKRGLAENFPRAAGRWIPRSENTEADTLARGELRRRGVDF